METSIESVYFTTRYDLRNALWKIQMCNLNKGAEET